MNRPERPARPRGALAGRLLLARGLTALRATVGPRRSCVVDGVRYRPRGAHSLTRALSRRGPGYKDYLVEFPSGARLRVRATARRVFPDLQPWPAGAVYAMLGTILRPGMRVAAVGTGTGAGAQELSRIVGPSGAVVALEPDEPSVRFARLRYPSANISFELGHAEELAGETPGAFDAALAVHALGEPSRDPPPDAQVACLWRTLGPGGLLVVSHPARAEASPGPTGPIGPVGGVGLSRDELWALIRPGLSGSAPPPPEPASGERPDGVEPGADARWLHCDGGGGGDGSHVLVVTKPSRGG